MYFFSPDCNYIVTSILKGKQLILEDLVLTNFVGFFKLCLSDSWLQCSHFLFFRTMSRMFPQTKLPSPVMKYFENNGAELLISYDKQNTGTKLQWDDKELHLSWNSIKYCGVLIKPLTCHCWGLRYCANDSTEPLRLEEFHPYHHRSFICLISAQWLFFFCF